MAQFGEEELISFVKRIIQGIFVGYHDRTSGISHMAKSGIVRGTSRTKQTLSDAWESTILEDLFGNPWHRLLHTVITETRLTKKFITDEKNLQRLRAENSMFLSADIETYGHIGSGPVAYAATEPREDEVRDRVGQEKQGGIHTKTESLRRTESKTRKELELSEVQGMCPRNLGTEMMSRWRFDKRTHLVVAS